MLPTRFLQGMSRCAPRAANRTRAISHHMMSTSTTPPSEHELIFESKSALRTFTLNRPLKLNALNEPMLGLLRPKIEEWSASDLCGTIVGTGVGRAFCAGGDVESVVQYAQDPITRQRAINFFKREFELDFILAALKKPYVAILDGFTMGGGVGLAAHATFRIATEKTLFAMPETKIGYTPDVGASYFMSRLDGELGTYLALTSDTLSGRAVFEHGFATHFIPSRRIPILLERLAALEAPHASQIDRTIEELSSEREPNEPPAPFTGHKRAALDFAFRHDQVEKIFQDLEVLAKDPDGSVSQWARETITTLHLRSPTSLKVALKAIRNGKKMTLLQALEMELKIATAFCNGASPDFSTGVTAVLIDKIKTRPNWSPSTLNEVTDDIVSRFFSPRSPYLSGAPELQIPDHLKLGSGSRKRFGLPTEAEIGEEVMASSPRSGAKSIRLDELLAKFEHSLQGKMGVKEKVLEVTHRKCQIVDNADGNFVWLKWKHAPTGR